MDYTPYIILGVIALAMVILIIFLLMRRISENKQIVSDPQK